MQVEEPFRLEEAYSSSINLSDTGYLVRNLFLVKRLTVVLYFLFGRNAKFLDYGGGYGVSVRLMLDYGFDFIRLINLQPICLREDLKDRPTETIKKLV